MIDKQKAMVRLDAFEAEAQALKKLIAEPEPWRPKKPTLCWVWDWEDKRDLNRDAPRVVTHYRNGDLPYSTSTRNNWLYAQPLTRDEALAMVDGYGDFDYPWHQAPSWAMWAATDMGGRAFWYGEKPFINDRPLWLKASDLANCGEISLFVVKPRDDWQLSLRPRPSPVPT